MTVPNIDTFENDIKEEIKHKEASIGDIASAGGVVSNSSPSITMSTPTKGRGLLIVGSIFGIIIVGAFGYLGYVYMQSRPTSQEDAAQIVAQEQASQNSAENIKEKINKVSPVLANGIARFVSQADTNAYGTTLTLTEYTSAFAFIIKHETELGNDIFKKELLSGDGTTTPVLSFADETISNQNMRVLSVASSTFVYAFVNEQYLLLANTPEDILRMRSAILK